MRSFRIPVALLLGLGVASVTLPPAEVAASREKRTAVQRIALEDDCDPRDLSWDEVGGCLLRKGTVTRAQFMLYSFFTPPTATTPPEPPPGTPLANAVIGHPSWRNNPGYLAVEAGDRLRVVNTGGRDHTFTPVVDWGAGFVPPLSFGLRPAPECADPAAVPVIEPGTRAQVTGLTPGSHKFQCCIHSWMRTLVVVSEDDDERDERE
jgi:plastocyanin